MICDNLDINELGHLTFSGFDTVDLVKKYGTPLYLLDENKIREKCHLYLETMHKYFGKDALPLYASKANCFKQMYKIVGEEHIGIDVVSLGELYTAHAAGFDLSKAFFHGNNKTDEDIYQAIKYNIGYFVVDNEEELLSLQEIAQKEQVVQKILIRITPGIDPHTYVEVATGNVDSKFGNAIATGQADKIVELALRQKNIRLVGLHCHVGSQVFTEDVHLKALRIMLDFVKHIKDKYNYETEKLNLGGGFGVRYVESDPLIDIESKIREIADEFHQVCHKLKIREPQILMEPGRSLIADSGLTLYSVGSVKKIIGYKNYVSVDGGMTDNPRYALYKSSYTCLCANKMRESNNFKCDLVGRCCESGDIIQKDILLPDSIRRNDLIAVCTTGAYNYSMSSNYNRLPKPPVVMLKDKQDYLVVKRESYQDLIRNDI
ncbi:MAG: diaminopimelate decarboxylase [Erysipelotrichia bacterium]|nr:diaminopimelate decarboxylase [Erysipelotrichia bacterium]